MNLLTIDTERRLSVNDVEAIGEADRTQVRFAEPVRQRMRAAETRLNEAAEAGHSIYGMTTGFGPFVKFSSGECAEQKHGAGLIAHLGAGCGNWAPREVVRGASLLRLWTVTRGHSGIREQVADAYASLLEQPFHPLVPEIGSVGASGDLVPLSHIARVLTGEGMVRNDRGEQLYAMDALSAVGMDPLSLRPRDALSLTNGTSFLTAYAAIAVARAERLIDKAEKLTAWAYALLGCQRQALDPRLHEARNQKGQIESARRIAEELERFDAAPDRTRPLQEVYSLRCAPQVIGACRDHLEYAKTIIERELEGVDDNPLVFADNAGPEGLPMAHGGNFQGQQVAFAADMLNEAMTQTAALIERQLDVVSNPQLNGGAPLLLASDPGPTSGIAGAQLTATALVAEMRSHCQMHGVYTIPTNGGNQDIVSMGTLAARRAFGQTEPLASVLGIQCVALQQLTHLRRLGIAPGVEPIVPDRPLHGDIARTGSAMLRRDEPSSSVPRPASARLAAPQVESAKAF